VTEKLFESTVALLERADRRGFLQRVALGATALTVAPLRYLLYPGSAYAATLCTNSLNCGANCPNGHCGQDGYTTFCCVLTGSNDCPANTFIGGFWRCSNYTGTKYCSQAGVRFYIDCNIDPDDSCTPGCAHGSCTNRAACCTCFRYGNCNNHIEQLTFIRCRIVRCTNPNSLYPGQCSGSFSTENVTCSHEASCL
jgi:hypothetical protein